MNIKNLTMSYGTKELYNDINLRNNEDFVNLAQVFF